MNIHKNGRLTPLCREEMAQAGMEGRLSKAHAARTYGVSAKIVARWVERFNAEGRAGTADRSSRPRVMPGMTAPSIAERIVALRRQRFAGSHIAIEVGVSAATVSRIMTDNGSCYRSKAFAKTCRNLGLKHVRTRPYTPRTQWQGGALPPDRAQGMGLCRGLSGLRPPRRTTAGLAAPRQLVLSARQLKVQNANQSPRQKQGQPVEASQLASRTTGPERSTGYHPQGYSRRYGSGGPHNCRGRGGCSSGIPAAP